MNAELPHEAGDDAEEGDVSEVAGFYQIVESISAVGGKRAAELEGEIPFGGAQFDLEAVRSFCRELGGIREVGGGSIVRLGAEDGGGGEAEDEGGEGEQQVSFHRRVERLG